MFDTRNQRVEVPLRSFFLTNMHAYNSARGLLAWAIGLVQCVLSPEYLLEHPNIR